MEKTPPSEKGTQENLIQKSSFQEESSQNPQSKASETIAQKETSDSPSEAPQSRSDSPLKVVEDIKRLLFAVSLFLIVAASFFSLDFLPGTLLGCAIVIFNFEWTVRMVRSLLHKKSLNPAILLAYVTKLGISGIVLYVALNPLGMEPIGLIVGLSSVVITTLAYSVLSTLRV